MQKQIFFDLDGVIFDSYGLWDNVVSHLLALKGLSLTKDIQEHLWSLSMVDADRYLTSLLYPDYEPEEISDIKYQFLIDAYSEVRLLRHTKELLEDLSETGWQLFAVTSNYKQIAEIGLQASEIYNSFTDVLSVMDTAFEEKDANYFQFIADKYSFDLSKIVIIDDSIANLKAAKKVKMKTIYFQNSLYPLRKEDYQDIDLILNDLSDLLSQINSLL